MPVLPIISTFKSSVVIELKRMLNSLVLLAAMILLLTGCYYDVEEELYGGTCDTLAVTYTKDITALLSAGNCIGCHSGGAPSGGVNLSDYASVKAKALDGSLYGALNHDAPYTAMPPTGGKLDNCSLFKVKAWVHQNTPQ